MFNGWRCWGSSWGAGPIRESEVIGQSWLDLPSDCTLIGLTPARSRPRVAPWTCCMLKRCVQPVLSLEGLSLPGWQVRAQERNNSRLKTNKNTVLFISSPLDTYLELEFGLTSKNTLFFSFSFSFALEKLTEDNGVPSIQRRCGRGGERCCRGRSSCQNQRTGNYTLLKCHSTDEILADASKLVFSYENISLNDLVDAESIQLECEEVGVSQEGLFLSFAFSCWWINHREKLNKTI